MAKIEKLKKDVEGVATTVYPVTIPQAVIDPTSGKSVRVELDEKAKHGYESNPKTLKEVDNEKAAHGYGAEPQKTLKQVDDEVIQLAGNVSVKMANLFTNGDFSNGITGWDTSIPETTYAVANGILTATRMTDGDSVILIRKQAGETPPNSVLYTRYRVRVLHAGATSISINYGGEVNTIISSPNANQWYDAIDRYTSGESAYLRSGVRAVYQTGQALTGYAMEVDYGIHINLTQMFGSGNEPTKEEMDLLISIMGVTYFEGAITIPNQKLMQWQLKLTSQSGLINSEYIQRVLTERAATLNDEVFRFPFAASGDKMEMGCNLIPDPSWNGNNNNYTCDLLRFTDKPYDAVGTNGIRVRSGSSGDIAIQSIINGSNTTIHSTNIKSNIPLAIKVVFEGDNCSLSINGERFELSGNYIGIISRNGGEVTFNPFSGSTGGYFYKGELLNLRMGVNLYVDNNPNPVVIADTNRFIVKPDFINYIPGSFRFHHMRVVDFSSLTSNGKTYISSNAGAARCAVFNIKEKGKKKIYLPLSITGDKSYLLDAVHLKPINGASIEKEEKGYMAMDQYIHPAIAYSSTALNGYNYFIFASNYPRENQYYEDDDLLVSVDGLTWERVLPYGEASAGEPQLPENVFLSGTDYGREKTFVPIPPAGTTFEMNGTNFTPARSLKHDPEILVEGGYLYLYNFYNFYESDGGSGWDASKYHRFVVVFRTNNLIDWEICRTDGSVISATSSNISEIFTQSSVDGKNNYIRHFNWIDNPNLKDSNMQVVKNENSGVWYAYYKDYGDYTNSNIGIKRYTGTSHLNFNWDTSLYCQSPTISGRQEHEDIFFYDGKYYYITGDFILESDDGINFTELPKLPIPILTAGNGYKTDVCIGANGNVFVANGCLPKTYNRPRAGYPYPSGGEVATIIFKLSSFQDIIDFAKNGKDFASLSVHISIFPKTGLAKSFNIPIVTPNTNWIYKELLEYEFEGGEDIGITILAHSCSADASIYYSNIIIE